MPLIRIAIISMFFGLILGSCKKETSWDVDVSVPIARSHLDLNNFFADTIFKADANGLLHLNYSKAIINYTMDSLVKLPDTTLNFGYTLPSVASLGVNPGDVLFSSTQETSLDITNGVELVKAIIRKGTIRADFTNTATQPINFHYEILSSNLWSVPFTIDETVAAGSPSHPTKITKYYAIDGYEIKMTGVNGNEINTIPQSYTIKIAPSAQSATLYGGEGLVAQVSYNDIVPEYVQGYFGQQNLTFGPDSTYLGILKNLQVSNLALQQASIQFNIINEFGVEFNSDIQSVKSINDVNNTTVALNSGNLLNAINVNRAGKTNLPSNPVFPYYKQINLTSTNSNLLPFIENLPDYLGYSVQAKLNPLGNVSASNDFAYYGHGLRVVADIDVPLTLSADYFKLVSYSNVDLTKVKQIDNVNSGELVLQATNNYPFSATIQGYMIDESGNVLDSLFMPGENILQGAVTDASNNVLQSTYSKLTGRLDNEGVQRLKLCKKIKFVSYFYLPNQPTPIKINDVNFLDLVLSVNVNYKAKTKL